MLNWLNSNGPTWLQLLVVLPLLVRADWYLTRWFRQRILGQREVPVFTIKE